MTLLACRESSDESRNPSQQNHKHLLRFSLFCCMMMALALTHLAVSLLVIGVTPSQTLAQPPLLNPRLKETKLALD